MGAMLLVELVTEELPPKALKAMEPRGATAGAPGTSTSPPPMEMLTVAVLPSESVATATSTVEEVAPAV